MIIGGKAENLLKLTENGLPVPPFQVIPANADDDEIPRLVELSLEKLRAEMYFEKVAVRSSSLNEDSDSASFAGVNETLLNVNASIDEVTKAVIKVRHGTRRAKIYTEALGISSNGKIAVIIMPMINTKIAGVAFTADPTSGNDDIIIEVVDAIGEELVSGRRNPTRYIIDKTNYKTVKIEGKDVLGDYLRPLIRYVLEIERIYKKPMDIEFAIDEEGIWILQARPITVIIRKKEVPPRPSGETLVKGTPASPGIAKGRVVVPEKPDDVKEGQVMVVKFTSPEWLPAMKRAAAIVTDVGGMLSHAAIVARELGIPAVVGTGDATEKLLRFVGKEVVVDGYRGEVVLPS